MQARHQGLYRAVVQRGPFGGLEGNVPASVEISEVRDSSARLLQQLSRARI